MSGTKSKAIPAPSSDDATDDLAGRARVPVGNASMTKAKDLAASRNVCVVGCKLPHGLVIQLEQLVGDKYIDVGPTFILLGANAANVIGGYGRTENVPREFMEKWLEQKEHFPPVANDLIFIEDDTASMEARAKEQAEIKSGAEPLSQDATPTGIKKFDAKDDGKDGT